MNLSTPSVSEHLSLDETIARLKKSQLVDGIAEFGSRTADHVSPASDYDLLILVTHIPQRVFQILTTINGRLADVVLVETEIADKLLTERTPPTVLFEQLFARKMQHAHLHYDRSDRLHQIQHLVTSPLWQAGANDKPSKSALASIWFWQSFGLLQLERMAKSQDAVRLLAVDMLLTACLSATWRGYFEMRALPWDGEKAALRYWKEYDAIYFQTLQSCLEATNRNERLRAYRLLVQQTIKPIGDVLQMGETAVTLIQAEHEDADRGIILRYWNHLFSQA